MRFLSATTFVLLTLIWGTTWAAIRIGLEGIPPLAGVGLRFGIAGALLLVVARALKVPLGRTRVERRLWLVNAVATFAGPYSIVYWAQQFIPSSLASVLFATFPLFVVIVAHFLLPAEPMSSRKLLGVLVGFAGVAMIFSGDFGALGSDRVAIASAVMLGSPILAAVGQIAIKRWGKGVHPISISAVPMLLTGLVIGGLSLVFERGRPVTLDATSISAVLYLSVIGSALTFSLYFWLLRRITATRLSLMAYLIPVVAVSIGVLFLGETVTARMLLGGAMVLGGVALAA